MLRGLDAAVARVRLTCQADIRQYWIKRGFEPIPCGVESLGYSLVQENGLGLSMVCLIDEDVGRSH